MERGAGGHKIDEFIYEKYFCANRSQAARLRCSEFLKPPIDIAECYTVRALRSNRGVFS